MPYRNAAEHVRSKGRGDDTMLVHMTPHEVGGLQALAMAHGGSLTINPDTGLPEAGWLGKLLPLIAGIGLNFILPGSGLLIHGLSTAAQAGIMTGIGATAITGSLKKGLMAGLGGFGGASLAAGVAGAIGGAAAPGVVSAAPGAVAPAITTQAISPVATLAGNIPGATGGLAAGASYAAPAVAPGVITNLAPGAVKTGFIQGFGNAAKGSMTGLAGKAAVPLATMGVLGGVSGAMAPKIKKSKEPVNEYGYTGPYTAQREVFNPYDTSQAPFDPANFDSSEKLYFSPTTSYADAAGNPYIPGQKTTPIGGNPGSSMGLNIPGRLTPEQIDSLQKYGTINPPQGYAVGGPVGDSTFTFPSQTSEQQPQMMPQPSPQLSQQQPPQYQQSSPYMQQSSYGQPQQQQQSNNPNGLGQISNLPGLARGGEVPLKQGSFVVDARTVSELGNGSSGAGQDLLARLGGMAIRGPGDGVSDSIRANIGGMQQARVARDEVQFSPEAVQRLGKGSHSRGTKKLYALMGKAQAARKSAKRGQDTGLRRGIA
jgi:hypothetical protein